MAYHQGLDLKSRSQPAPQGGGHEKIDLYWVPAQGGTFRSNVSETDYALDLGEGIQITESKGHPWSNRKSKRQSGDIGGDFFTTRSYIEGELSSANISNLRYPLNQFFEYHYNFNGNLVPFDGPYVPDSGGVSAYPEGIHSSPNELDEYGTTAIARCAPGSSAADLLTAIMETIKDGLPHLVGSQTWRDRTVTAKNASSEFLNVEFGWLPLVNDITEFTSAVTHAQELIAQYERDAGRVVRRRYAFPTEESSSTEVIKENWYPQGSSMSPSPGEDDPVSLVRKTSKEVDRWFSGAFTYYLPTDYDSRKAMDRYALFARRITGLELNPNTLWELAPWSWAVDWFSNAGDVVSNVNRFASGNLYLHYGYIMERSIVKHTYSTAPTTFHGQSVPGTELTYVTETKVRKRANPFGFGVTWDGLSPLQAAIAAAVGMSRGR